VSEARETKKPPAFADAKGGENLKPQYHEEHKRHSFDSFCKKILKHEARDYYDELKRRRGQEISLEELSEKEWGQLAVMDECFKDIYSFNVLGHDITVADECIGEALNALPMGRCDIILLSYFLDMTDREIGERLNLVRRTVAYRRQAAATLTQSTPLLDTIRAILPRCPQGGFTTKTAILICVWTLSCVADWKRS
jgi:DNA-directed RNA polymerase specialized sigma subunit, sigma24 homolog